MLGCKANYITFTRALLLIVATPLFFLGETKAIIGVVLYQLVLLLDTMDGAIARYNKETSFLGEAMDLILDHLSSTILYFVAFGAVGYGIYAHSFFIWTPAVCIVLAHYAAFVRAVYTEYGFDVEKLRQNTAFRFFHQDNMRLLLLMLTITIIATPFNAFALSALGYVYVTFLAVKALYLKIKLATLTGDVFIPFKAYVGYFLGVLFIVALVMFKPFGQKPHFLKVHLEKHHGTSKIVKTLLAISQHLI